jgi:hypothetical protein
MNSAFPAGDFSAFSSFQDPLNFVKKMWGDLQVPGMVTPSMSQEDLDKQIHDLKAVENWLQMHMNVLRTTIQGLEVQKATLHALKTMGEQFSQMKPSDFSTSSTAEKAKEAAASASAKNEANATNAFPDGAQWWMGLQEQFQQALSQVAKQTTAPTSAPETANKPKAAAAKTSSPNNPNNPNNPSKRASTTTKASATRAKPKTTNTRTRAKKPS